jgi:putative transposase
MNALVAESRISEALDLGEKAVRLRAVKDNWPVRKVQKQGGNELYFVRDLLPVDVQASLVVRASVTGAGLPDVIHDRPVPGRSNKIGLAKYNLVHAFRLAKRRAGWGEKNRAAADFLLAYNTGALMAGVFAVVGPIRERTLDALDKRLRENDDNYLCLCDGRGGWKKHGTTKYKARKLTEQAKEVFLKCYLSQSRPTVMMAIRAARITLEKADRPEHCDDSTWRRWLRDYETYNAGVICLAREGMKAYKDKFVPYISRDSELLEVGQCLVADGKTLNFNILHPITGRPCRMTLLVFFDWKSRYPVGWQILPTENQWGILAAFRNAVITLGRYPDSVYLDNGRAFKSKLFQGEGRDLDFEEMTGLYARVGTAVMFAQPYNGRAKVVERFFRTFQWQVEPMMPSYCGDSIQTKPARLHRNETFHQALHEARTGNWVPNIREASVIIARYIQWYAEQYHRGMKATPAERLLPNRGPGVDAYQLTHDFLVPVDIHVRRGRAILWGIEYESDAFHNLAPNLLLKARVDAADMGRIWCYTTDGTYLGEALPVQACHPLATLFGDQVSIDRVTHEIKRHARVVKNARQQLEALGITKNSPDSMNILSFAATKEKTPILPARPQGRKQKQLAAPVSEQKAKQLEMICQKAEAEKDLAPVISRPKYWNSDLEHYEWVFRLVHEHGQCPSADDQAFYTEFESLPEFKNYRQRFEDLKLIYKQ